MEKEENKIQLKTTAKPMFADEVIVGTMIKAMKQKDEVTKEAHVRLGFIDMTKREIFDEVILSPMTAKALVKILSENLSKLDEQMASKEIPKQPIQTKKTEELTYIG